MNKNPATRKYAFPLNALPIPWAAEALAHACTHCWPILLKRQKAIKHDSKLIKMNKTNQKTAENVKQNCK